jgi:hypothetical protein
MRSESYEILTIALSIDLGILIMSVNEFPPAILVRLELFEQYG